MKMEGVKIRLFRQFKAVRFGITPLSDGNMGDTCLN